MTMTISTTNAQKGINAHKRIAAIHTIIPKPVKKARIIGSLETENQC
jgi:hypothetical protein